MTSSDRSFPSTAGYLPAASIYSHKIYCCSILHVKLSVKTWERKILRTIYCPIKAQNGWRSRINGELQVMYRQQNIVTTINVIRLEWVGHVVRMSDDRTVKYVFLEKPYGRRKAGSPRLRWLYCIGIDLKWTGVKRWRKETKDISLWAIILKEALFAVKDRKPVKKKMKMKKKNPS